MHSILDGNNFKTAAREYFWLLNRAYPEKRSRLLVADRYHLDRHQRTALYRGIFPHDSNTLRIAKAAKFPPAKGLSMAIDLLNILHLISNYLYGRNVFHSTDLFLRDDGENFSRLDNHRFLPDALHLLGRTLASFEPSEVQICIKTSQISRYPEFLKNPSLLRDNLRTGSADVHIISSAHIHRQLIESRADIIATSDSVVLDSCAGSPLDLGGCILSVSFNARLPDLHGLIYEKDPS